MKLLTTWFSALFLLVILLGLSACNTAEGIGEDLRAAGDGIRRAAE